MAKCTKIICKYKDYRTGNCRANKLMGCRYEIRYYINDTSNGTRTEFTDSWLEFMWLRITEDVIYYRVHCDICSKAGKRRGK